MENNKLICPFCQQELLLSSFRDGDKDNEIWNCLHCQIGGKRKLWQELIRTRKALDVLLFTINRLENQNYKDCAWHLRLAIAKIEATGIANKALEQITALEQKD